MSNKHWGSAYSASNIDWGVHIPRGIMTGEWKYGGVEIRCYTCSLKHFAVNDAADVALNCQSRGCVQVTIDWLGLRSKSFKLHLKLAAFLFPMVTLSTSLRL